LQILATIALFKSMEKLNLNLNKTPLTLFILSLLLFVGLSFNSYAQDAERIFTTVSFMKVKMADNLTANHNRKFLCETQY